MPSDLAMADLVHAHRTLHEHHDCVMCESEAATALCVTCGDMFCAACSKFHVKQSVSKHHQVAPLTSLTSQQVSGSRHATCAVHRDKPAELFCPAHDVIMCHVCATSRHRGCSELREVEERVEEARAVLRTLTATLTAGEARLDQGLRQLDDHVTRTEKESQAALAELKTLCQRLETALFACRQHVEHLARAATSDVTGAAREAKACLLQRRARLTSHKHVVQRVQDSQDGDTVTAMTPVIKTRVEQLDCSLTLPDTAKVVSKVTVLIDHEAVTRIEKELSQLGQVKVMPADVDVQLKEETEVLAFHKNCGDNIVLSNDNKTAERQGDTKHCGIVLSSQPMKTNTLYEVCVDQKESRSDASRVLNVGVTTAAPDTLSLPSIALCLPDAVVITGGSVQTCTTTSVGQKLFNLPKKNRVGVLLDDTRCLHLYINGVDQGVAAPNLTHPCYSFFDLWETYRQVTALPVTRMQ